MAEPGSFGSEANNNFHCWPFLYVFTRVVNNKGLFFLMMLVHSAMHFLFASRQRRDSAGYCRASPQQP
jgi:hypothetical protein